MVMSVRQGHCVLSNIIPGTMTKLVSRSVLAIALVCLVTACSQTELAPHMRPLSKDTMMLLGKKGMDTNAPLFVRIFKEESELEVWKQRPDGHFYHFKTYPICNWSGDLGPKKVQGDKQAPEGFYAISRDQMNPNSQFHLAFNIGYPNAYDRAHGRSGNFLMVHGKCKSAGCYAMTDALIEEIYALAREAFIGGADGFQVHAFPFRLTEANLARHRAHTDYAFWQTLKEGYDYFETTHLVPDVVVCQKQYLVNVKLRGGQPVGKVDPEGQCPALERGVVVPFTPLPGAQEAGQMSVSGPKMHLTKQGQTNQGPMSQVPITPEPLTQGPLTQGLAAGAWRTP